MAVDDARNRVYVSDPTVGQVRVYNLQGQFIEASAGAPAWARSNLGSARQPAVATNGTLYVAEYGNARVHRFTPEGDDAGFFPNPAQPAVAGQFGEPRDVDVDDETGDVWVADSWNQRFQRFKSTGEFIGTWGTRSASPEYGMNYPRGIGIDPVSRRVWVANQRGHHIKRYEYDGDLRRPARRRRDGLRGGGLLPVAARHRVLRRQGGRLRPQLHQGQDPRRRHRRGDRLLHALGQPRHGDRPRQRQHLRRGRARRSTSTTRPAPR